MRKQRILLCSIGALLGVSLLLPEVTHRDARVAYVMLETRVEWYDYRYTDEEMVEWLTLGFVGGAILGLICDLFVSRLRGEKKADAIKKAVEGPFSPDVPASLLQDHPDCTFILDEGAASKLSK